MGHAPLPMGTVSCMLPLLDVGVRLENIDSRTEGFTIDGRKEATDFLSNVSHIEIPQWSEKR